MRDPDITGRSGRAWQAQLTEEDHKRWPASLGLWLLHCPGAHPVWNWYAVAACSLADLPGLQPAHRHDPNMTHELQIFVLNPEYQPEESWCVAGAGSWAANRLEPANLVEQIPDLSDEAMAELVRLLVRSFCDGLLSPDTDWRSAQRQAIAATADHLRAGRHIPS